MRHAKALLVVIAAVVLTLALAAPAFAASITIKSGSSTSAATSETTSYTYYQIFSASIKTDATVNQTSGELTQDGVAAYTIPVANADLAALVDATDVFSATLSADGTYYVIALENSAATGEDIAAALNTDAIKAKAISTGSFAQTTPGGNATSGTVDPGYYLVVSSLGDELVVQTLSDVTITEKNSYPSVTKTVNSGSESAQIGTDVTYTITVTLPESADKQVVVTDTLSNGLTYKSATVNGGVTGAVSNSGQVTTITFTPAVVAANAGSDVTITFVATLNANAVVQGTDANTNEVSLTYDNKYTTKTTTVGTDTQKIRLLKYDGDAPFEAASADDLPPAIAGAVFELHDAAGNAVKMTGSGTSYTVDPSGSVTQITTVANDPIVVSGLDADVTYTWVEITPPTGYNGLTAGQDVTPSMTSIVTSQIANHQGSTLPSTGGMGTTILYLVGGLLVLVALVGFVIHRRMNGRR